MTKNAREESTRAGLPMWIWLFLAIVVLVVATYVRVVAVQGTEVVAPIRADAREYYNYAYNMKNFGVYSIQDFESSGRPTPDARRNPGYALFLLPFVEHPPTFEMVYQIALAQAFLSAATVLFALFSFRSFLAWPWALIASLLMAISPHLIIANVYVLTETFFTALLTGFLAVLSWFGRRPHWGILLFAGCILGAALLVRPTLQYFLIVLVPALFLLLPRKRAGFAALALVLGFSFVYAPWIVRNQLLPDSAVSSKALDTLHKGMYPDLMFNGDPNTYGFPNRADPEWNERRHSTEMVMAEIQRRFQSEPLRYIQWYLIGKPVTFLSWDMIVGMGDVFVYPVKKTPYFQLGALDLTHRFMKGLHWPVTILSLVACVLLWLPRAQIWLPGHGLFVARVAALIVGYFLLVHIAGTPLPRYAVPLKPLIYGLGVLGGVLVHRLLTDSIQIDGHPRQ